MPTSKINKETAFDLGSAILITALLREVGGRIEIPKKDMLKLSMDMMSSAIVTYEDSQRQTMIVELKTRNEALGEAVQSAVEAAAEAFPQPDLLNTND